MNESRISLVFGLGSSAYGFQGSRSPMAGYHWACGRSRHPNSSTFDFGLIRRYLMPGMGGRGFRKNRSGIPQFILRPRFYPGLIRDLRIKAFSSLEDLQARLPEGMALKIGRETLPAGASPSGPTKTLISGDRTELPVGGPKTSQKVCRYSGRRVA